jgi:O-acetylserine/cysteine efflux transporter
MNNTRRMVFPALIAAGILWGTTVPLSKVALGWMGPAWLAFTRFALGAAVLMIVSRFRLRAACSPGILISGAAGYGGSVLLQNLGIERTSVTHAALLIGVTPVLVALLAAALGHSVARPLAWAGFALSLAGVGVIAGGHGGGATLGGDGLVLASQLASAGFTVSQARLLRDRDPVAVTALQLMAAAAAVLPIALLTGHVPSGLGSPAAMLATTGLVLAGTVLPTTLFAFSQSRVSADVAGAFLNLEPLFGAAFGVVLLSEPLGAAQLAGGAVIVAGIAMSSLQVMRDERLRRAAPAGVIDAAAPALALAAAAAPRAAADGRPVLVLAGPADREPDHRGPATVRRLDQPHPRITESRRQRRTRRAAARFSVRSRPARSGQAGQPDRNRGGRRAGQERRDRQSGRGRERPPGAARRPGRRRLSQAGMPAARH